MQRSWIPLLLSLACVNAMSACAGGSRTAMPLASQRSPQAPSAKTLAPAALPVPSDLAGQLAVPRSSSYVPEDLKRDGSAFEAALPRQNVAAQASGGLYSAHFGQLDHPGLSGLAFATYEYDLADYAGNAAIAFGWASAPPADGTCFIGLANWGRDSWDWFRCPAASPLELASLTPYKDGAGRLLACVLMTGNADSVLEFLRVGSQAPDVQLTASVAYGITPLSVSFDASASSDADGTIAEYRWDPDGDGIFDQATGTAPQLDYDYIAGSGGDLTVAVRAVDNDGVYNSATVKLAVVDDINFSFGDEAGQEVQSMLVAPDGDLLVFHNKYEVASGNNIVFERLSPNRTVRFIKEWGGDGYDTVEEAAFAPDGTIVVCGSTTSYGSPASALLQNWSLDGELLWSKYFRQTDVMLEFRALCVTSDAIYAAGAHDPSGNGQPGMVARLGLDGSLTWLKELTTAENSYFSDMLYFVPAQIGDVEQLKLCGTYSDGTAVTGYSNPMYAACDLDGNFLECRVWHAPSTNDFAEAISQTSALTSPKTYISGSMIEGHGNDLGYIVSVGGSGRVIDAADSGLNMNVLAMRARGIKNLSLLLERFTQTGNTIILANFNETLTLTAQTELSAPDPSSCYAKCLSPYGSGILVGGYQLGSLPQEGDCTLSVSTPAYVWTDESTASTAPAGISVLETSTATTGISGWSFDRELGDGDQLFHLF